MSGIALPPSETNVFRIVAAIRSLSLFVNNNTREALNADRDYYVGPTGSDSNSGATSATPYLTTQKAMDVLSSTLDFDGRTVAVHVADGTYTGGLQVKPWVGGGVLQFQGNAATPANVLVSTTSANAIDASFGPLTGIFRLKDMKLKCTTAGFAIVARSPGRLQYTNIVFDTTPNAHVAAGTQGNIEPYGNNQIVGGTGAHFVSDGTALINTTALDLPSPIGTCTLTGTPAFLFAFAIAQNQSAQQVSGITFSGSGTGQRYGVSGSAVINTLGGGPNYFPGNSLGSTTGSGQYS